MAATYFPHAVTALDHDLSPYERLILGPPALDASMGVSTFGAVRLRATLPECMAVIFGAAAAIVALATSVSG